MTVGPGGRGERYPGLRAGWALVFPRNEVRVVGMVIVNSGAAVDRLRDYLLSEGRQLAAATYHLKRGLARGVPFTQRSYNERVDLRHSILRQEEFGSHDVVFFNVLFMFPRELLFYESLCSVRCPVPYLGCIVRRFEVWHQQCALRHKLFFDFSVHRFNENFTTISCWKRPKLSDVFTCYLSHSLVEQKDLRRIA